MKTKSLVMLGSFLVFTALIVCVSVYSYNAYCAASQLGCSTSASGNGWGLFNGYYYLHAKVGSDTETKTAGFANGQNFSDTASAHEPGCGSGDGYAEARVTGFDAHGNVHHKNDTASF